MAEDLVEMPVIEMIVDPRLQGLQRPVIEHEAVLVEVLGLKLHHGDVVVPVQPCAGVIVWQVAELVAGGEVELLGDGEHHLPPFSIASSQ